MSTRHDIIHNLRTAIEAVQTLPCEHCGWHPGLRLGPSAVETSRARAGGLETKVERLEDGIAAALKAYAADDGNAAQAGHDLALAITKLLDEPFRRAQGVPDP